MKIKISINNFILFVRTSFSLVSDVVIVLVFGLNLSSSDPNVPFVNLSFECWLISLECVDDTDDDLRRYFERWYEE